MLQSIFGIPVVADGSIASEGGVATGTGTGSGFGFGDGVAFQSVPIEAGAAAAASTSNEDDWLNLPPGVQLSPEDQARFAEPPPTSVPFPIRVTSGKVVWGPMPQALKGALAYQTQRDEPALPSASASGPGADPKDSSSGKINYLSNAKNGDWQIARIYEGRRPRGRITTWSWFRFSQTIVIHHSSASAVDLANRCYEVSLSLHQDHDDERIKYVNRYDWGYHCSMSHEIRHIVSQGHPRIPESVRNIFTGFSKRSDFVFADAEGAVDSIKTVIDHANDIHADTAHHFHPMPYTTSSNDASSSSQATPSSGCFVTLNGREYELGWLVFDDDDQLIGLVYDLYSGFSDADETYPLRVEEVEIVPLDPVQLEPIKQARRLKLDQRPSRMGFGTKHDRKVVEQLFTNRGDKTIKQMAEELSGQSFDAKRVCAGLISSSSANAGEIPQSDLPAIYKDLPEIMEEMKAISIARALAATQAEEAEEKARDVAFTQLLVSLVPASSPSSISDEEEKAQLRSIVTKIHESGLRPGGFIGDLEDSRFPDGWITKLLNCESGMKREERDNRWEETKARAEELKRNYLLKHPEETPPHKVIDEDNWREVDKAKDDNDEFSLREIFEVHESQIIEASTLANSELASTEIVNTVANELYLAGIYYKRYSEMLHYWATNSSRKCGRNTTPVYEAIVTRLERIVEQIDDKWIRCH